MPYHYGSIFEIKILLNALIWSRLKKLADLHRRLLAVLLVVAALSISHARLLLDYARTFPRFYMSCQYGLTTFHMPVHLTRYSVWLLQSFEKLSIHESLCFHSSSLQAFDPHMCINGHPVWATRELQNNSVKIAPGLSIYFETFAIDCNASSRHVT